MRVVSGVLGKNLEALVWGNAIFPIFMAVFFFLVVPSMGSLFREACREGVRDGGREFAREDGFEVDFSLVEDGFSLPFVW